MARAVALIWQVAVDPVVLEKKVVALLGMRAKPETNPSPKGAHKVARYTDYM